MSTGSVASAYVTCPKCDGSKYIMGFRHYAAGVCFMCAGNGTVDAARAMKAAGIVRGAATGPACKQVDLGGLGTATVYRKGSGFQADIFCMSEESGRVEPTGMVAFDVVAGKLANVIVSDGPRRRGEGPALVAALQAALKR